MPRAARLCPIVAVLALSGGVAAMAAPLPQSVFVARGNGYCSAYYVKLNRLPTPRTLAGMARAEFPVAGRLIAAIDRGDGALVQSLTARLVTRDKHYDALANSVGLTICGKPTSH